MMRKVLYLSLLLILGGAIFISISTEAQLRDNYSNTYVVSAVEQEVNMSKMISKPIFDSTDYLQKNPANVKIFPPIKLFYHQSLLPISKDQIDVQHLQQLAKTLPKSTLPYILDIELWDVHTLNDLEANRNIDKYILVIDTMKKTRPDLKFGFYGVLPNRDYFAPVTQDPEKLQEWNRINQRLKRLALHVDFVCPSLYTFYKRPEEWKRYALENIKRAKEYGKPVYPFLWPQYHEGGAVRPIREFIDTTFWKMELDLVYREADGIIIWGGYGENSTLYWDDNAQWWQLTKRFITEKK